MKLRGRSVLVQDNNYDKALRKFKKKINESGILDDVKKLEYYEKPTTTRKRKKSAAKNRWKKYLESQQLPPRLF